SPASDLDPLNLAPHAETFNEAPAEALKPEQAEAERPEVVAYADPIAFATFKKRGHEGGVVGREWMWAEPSAGLVAMSRTDECECIIGELRTEIAMLRSYESGWELLLNQHEQERGAALARVAEHEATLAELERQEPVSTEHLPMHIAYARAKREVFLGSCQEDVFRFALIDLLQESPLYAHPVAQAQHSVPEEFSFEYRHPNGECHTVTVSREQVINEMPDFLFEALCSKFCNCEPVGETNVVECCCDEYAEEFKLIAAAPGKEGV
ncbi:TPA: hypothetical protein L3677_005164, partial [Pseudomonas aeruginosa]|nr:hypothetical protein [Pseudomonas aeruginosa]